MIVPTSGSEQRINFIDEDLKANIGLARIPRLQANRDVQYSARVYELARTSQ